jgi:hypothetical protein
MVSSAISDPDLVQHGQLAGDGISCSRHMPIGHANGALQRRELMKVCCKQCRGAHSLCPRQQEDKEASLGESSTWLARSRARVVRSTRDRLSSGACTHLDTAQQHLHKLLGDSPRNPKAIVGGRAPPQLIHNDQRPAGGTLHTVNSGMPPKSNRPCRP